MIDTAIMYGTEKGVGIGIKRALNEGLIKREDLTVTTKLPPYDQSVEKVQLRKQILDNSVSRKFPREPGCS